MARTIGHSYRDGRNGRRLSTRPGVGSTTIVAHLTCSQCTTESVINFRTVPGPDIIDQKFAMRGWKTAKRLCPNCAALKSREKQVGATPSPAAMKAQVQMFELLSMHFDKDAGAYAAGWSDQKIATDTGLSRDHVIEFRRAGFGELKEPSEIRTLRSDITALEKLQAENNAHIQQDIAALRTRVANLAAKWSA